MDKNDINTEILPWQRLVVTIDAISKLYLSRV